MHHLKSLPTALTEKLKNGGTSLLAAAKWLLTGLATGAAGGLVGSFFCWLVNSATALRGACPWLIWLLPAGGLAIAGIYRLSHVSLDTNAVFRAVRGETALSPLMPPLMIVSAGISHLFGASVGREGAALQIGGSLGYMCGRLLHLDKRDMHVLVMCGMSAVFSAVFGTPITATFFSLEVTSVGNIYYAGLFPCLAASLTASAISRAFGLRGFSFALSAVPAFDAAGAVRAAVLGVLCAVLSIVFCVALHRGERLAKRLFKNDFLRIAVCGAIVTLMTLLLKTTDYNGAGGDIITRAVNYGQAQPLAFALKLIFTVVCISGGYKGGEIVPTLFIGACFGCTVGPLLGLPAGFAAALAMPGLFCGMVNSPISSILLSIELFGAEQLPFFVIVCTLSYLLSGNYSLYHEQRILSSKMKATYIDED